MRRPLTWAIIALALVVAALAIGVYRVVIHPPSPFEFTSTRIERHELAVGEHLIVTAKGRMTSPECSSGARRVLRFSDHSEASVPGERRMIDRHYVTIIYDITIPLTAPSGPATVQVYEIFTCGIRQEVASPAISFLIRGTVEPAIDRHYTQGRNEGDSQ